MKPNKKKTYCSTCNAYLNVDEGVYFCPTCGGLLKEIEIYKEAPVEKKRMSKKAKAILVSTLSCIIIAVGTFGIVTYVSTQKIENTYNLILSLPNEADINYELNEGEIIAAKNAYEALNDKQKNKVENKDKLMAIVSSYNTFKVDNVKSKAEEINVETVGSTDVLADFSSMYSALTEEQKILLTTEEIVQFDNYIKVYNVTNKLKYIDEDVGTRYSELASVSDIYNTIQTEYLELVYNSELFNTLEEKYALREYVEVKTVADLKGLANQSGKYKLVNDIDVSTVENWEPIENFSGELHGNGYSIKNLTIKAIDRENVGLFAYLYGTVKSLKITNANVSLQGDKYNVAILAGSCNGTVDNVQVSGSVVAKYASYVGGIVGDMNIDSRINNCINYASVTGKTNVGGVFGEIDTNASGTIDNNINNGAVVGDENVGGIAGYIQNIGYEEKTIVHTVSNNINNGEVTGNAKVGGIFGQVYGGVGSGTWRDNGYSYFEMTLLKNNAKITASGNDVGGLIGYGTRVKKITISENNGDIVGVGAVGGFVGYCPSAYINASGFTNVNTITGGNRIGAFAGEAGVIENATNSGKIVFINSTATEARVGGIAGYCHGLINCVNNSDITVTNGLNCVGGLAGQVYTYNSNNLNNNTNNGKVTATDSENVGGICGYLENVAYEENTIVHTVSNNTNNKEVVGKAKVGGIVGQVYGGVGSGTWRDDGYSYFEVVNSTNNARIFGESYVGGIVGYYTRLKTDANLMDSNTTLFGEKLGK